nr:STAS domain-containing protein [Geodermatophilus sp. LHW52908]
MFPVLGDGRPPGDPTSPSPPSTRPSAGATDRVPGGGPISYGAGIDLLPPRRTTLTVTGELTEDARRPMVRVVTDLLLAEPGLRRLRLDARGVGYLNSAGISVLVQLEKLGRPRGVDLVLVDPPPAVTRPLQASGLWPRFAVEEAPGS